jgi:TPR repeat protein
MADLAHDASGPASPRPGGLAPQQASRPDSPDRGKLRVFISYSREDSEFADQLDAALSVCGFECVLDRHGISGGEDWKRRLGNLIREADTVVFVLSPISVRSEICAWEVEEAGRLGKRILPINCRPLKGASPPLRLRDLNYIFFHSDPKNAPGSGFGTGLASLVEALNTDFDWLREHTRYLQRATEWDRGGRPANRLLSGDGVAEAKAWVARRPKSAPEPTALHLDFIRASEEEAEARSSAQRKQLEAMAAAQAERETALRQAEEAVKQAADAQRKRARIRNVAFVVVSIFAVIAGWLFLRAEQERRLAEEQRAVAEEQRAVAEEQREQADHILEAATNIFRKSRDRMDLDTRKEVFAVFRMGADRGVATSMVNLGWLYRNGFGVTQDDVKAREWYEKAADKGHVIGMNNLAVLHRDGLGVPQDYAKARELFEKAAAKGYALAISNLENLPIREAAGAGRYTEALQLQEAVAVKTEEVETKREGNAGKETAQVLGVVAWRALFVREFTRALTVSDRAHALLPDSLGIDTNRAHALMFLGRGEECNALYLAHKGKPMSGQDARRWEHVIAKDFAEFRKAGLTHPMMADIERELGVSPDGNSDIGNR